MYARVVPGTGTRSLTTASWARLFLLLPAILASACGSARDHEIQAAVLQERIVHLESELAAARLATDSLAAAAREAEYALSAEREQAAVSIEALEEQSILPGSLWRPVYFDVAEAAVESEGKDILDRYAQLLEANPAVRLGLIGRADPRGSEAYNLELSARRARSVQDYLLEQGIEEWRLEVVAAGEGSPLVDLATDAGLAENRSVQVVVLDAGPELQIRSNPPGATAYVFPVGRVWDMVKGQLHDPAAIETWRVKEGYTNVNTNRGRTWYHLMVVKDAARRFACGYKVKGSAPNLVTFEFDDRRSPPCR